MPAAGKLLMTDPAGEVPSTRIGGCLSYHSSPKDAPTLFRRQRLKKQTPATSSRELLLLPPRQWRHHSLHRPQPPRRPRKSDWHQRTKRRASPGQWTPISHDQIPPGSFPDERHSGESLEPQPRPSMNPGNPSIRRGQRFGTLLLLPVGLPPGPRAEAGFATEEVAEITLLLIATALRDLGDRQSRFAQQTFGSRYFLKLDQLSRWAPRSLDAAGMQGLW